MTQKIETTKDKKEKRFKERLGYIGLGVCVDYFIFRPARKLRYPVFITIGFVCGMIFEFGLENAVSHVKMILGK